MCPGGGVFASCGAWGVIIGSDSPLLPHAVACRGQWNLLTWLPFFF